MVSGKTKMMKTIHQLFYITTKRITKITDAAKSKTVKLTIKEEENKVSL